APLRGARCDYCGVLAGPVTSPRPSTQPPVGAAPRLGTMPRPGPDERPAQLAWPASGGRVGRPLRAGQRLALGLCVAAGLATLGLHVRQGRLRHGVGAHGRLVSESRQLLDVTGFLPGAEREARRIAPDAELISISAHYIDPEGMDHLAYEGAMLQYRFR